MYWLIPIALAIIFIIVLFIPTGNKCPECGSKYTIHIKGAAIKETTKKVVHLELDRCFKCENIFNVYEDGKLVNLKGESLDDM